MAVDILPEMRVARQSDRITHFVSAAKTATFNTVKKAVGPYNEAVMFLDVTAASGTSPTLDVKIQTSPDNGTTWFDEGTAFTQAVAATKEIKKITNFGDIIRAVCTIGGTTPSFTFSLKMVGKS